VKGYSKEKNALDDTQGGFGHGDVWTCGRVDVDRD
jgi:hypothetical protein